MYPSEIILFSTLLWIGMSKQIEPDPSKSIIWGPGLNPDVVILKARYIFLQLRDSAGQNITSSPGTKVVSVQVTGKKFTDDQPCPVWPNVLDCQDGSFIIQYKLTHTCTNFKLVVKINNQDTLVMEKPGPIYEEECPCPRGSVENWLKMNECSTNNPQMDEDFKLFPSIDYNEIREGLIEKFHKPESVSICHYVIKTNRVYRKCYGKHVGYKIFMDSILLALTRRLPLPDLEFFINLGDWPLVKIKDDKLYPILSWCGSRDTRDIILPTHDLIQSSLEAMGRVTVDMLSVQGNTGIPWEKKPEVLFWRGRDSNKRRLDLIDIARTRPELFNVSITNFFFFKEKIDRYGPSQPHVSFFDFFKYKYELNLDGTVAAYRFPYLLAGGSPVFKQDSPYHEFFYRQLDPWTHYLPVKHDLSNLVENLLWAKKNDRTVKNIAKNARQFARDHLMPQNILCYYVSLFNVLHRRLKNQIQVQPDMELVDQPNHSCPCRTTVKTEL